MATGQIAENKTRTNITIEKELKSKLEEIAKQDKRSFNSLVIKILTDYVDSAKK